jgi:hypothetical protein
MVVNRAVRSLRVRRSVPAASFSPLCTRFDKVLRLRDELGFSYLTLFEKDFERFAPVLAELEGR